MAAFGLFVFLLTTPVSSEPVPEVDWNRVDDSDGRFVARVRQSPLDEDRYTIVGARGQHLGNVQRHSDARQQLDVQTPDGRRRAVLKSNPSLKSRIDEFNARGERTGFWERSSSTGRWHRYSPDGRRGGTARRMLLQLDGGETVRAGSEGRADRQAPRISTGGPRQRRGLKDDKK